jgi:cytochrome c oxidase assembly factor CtaG
MLIIAIVYTLCERERERAGDGVPLWKALCWLTGMQV